MGEFIHMALTKQRDLSKIQKMISEASEENKENIEELQVKEENCWCAEHDGGISITFVDDIPNSKFLSALSSKIGSPLLFLYIYDGDFWGYTLYDMGKEVDDFSTMPDYFIQSGSDKTKSSEKHAALIEQYFGVSKELIRNYLIAWTDELMQSKEAAYPDDTCFYGDSWQMLDFVEKLGFPCEEENSIEEPENENEERNKDLPKEKDENEKMIRDALSERANFVNTSKTIPIWTQFPAKKNTEELPNALDLDYINAILTPETKEIFRLTEMGKYRQALQEFTQKIKENPEDANLYILRAYCYRALRNRMEMDRDLDSALKYEPDNIRILRYRCPAAATTNRYKRHIKDLTRLMELDKENYNIYLLSRAWRYYWVGDKNAAYSDVTELIQQHVVWSADLIYLCESLDIEIPFHLVGFLKNQK